jgi:hypothetical protein
VPVECSLAECGCAFAVALMDELRVALDDGRDFLGCAAVDCIEESCEIVDERLSSSWESPKDHLRGGGIELLS